MPPNDRSCLCGGTGADGICRPPETTEYGIGELRRAVAIDAATRLLADRRPFGLRAAIAGDASRRLSGLSRSARPGVVRELPAASPISDPVSAFLSEERHAELP
jgi:hypothetical protein